MPMIMNDMLLTKLMSVCSATHSSSAVQCFRLWMNGLKYVGKTEQEREKRKSGEMVKKIDDDGGGMADSILSHAICIDK